MRPKRSSRLPSPTLLVLLLSYLLAPTSAQAWEGKVVGVTDGDTISVMRDGQAVKVRLAGVAALIAPGVDAGAQAELTPAEAKRLAQEARLFGLPLVMFEKQFDVNVS